MLEAIIELVICRQASTDSLRTRVTALNRPGFSGGSNP